MNMEQVKNQLGLNGFRQHQQMSELDNCVIIYCSFVKLPEIFKITNKQTLTYNHIEKQFSLVLCANNTTKNKTSV